MSGMIASSLAKRIHF